MIDTEGRSATQHIRERLLKGETLTSNQVAAEYGASKSLLGVTLRKMTEEGHKFDKTKVGEGRAATLSYRHAGKGEPVPRQAKKRSAQINGYGLRKGSLIDKVVHVLDQHVGELITAEQIAKKSHLEMKQVNGTTNGLIHGRTRGLEGRLVRVGRGVFRWNPANLPAVPEGGLSTNGDGDHVDEGPVRLPHPSLYDELKVKMMALDGDTLTIAVQNETTAWLCEVVGIQELTPPSRRGRAGSGRGRG